MIADQHDSASASRQRIARVGTDAPLPERQWLRAGPLRVLVEEGDLRYVTLGDEEIVRRIYGAVRDRNWDTIAPRFTAYEVAADDQAFSVRFTAEHVGQGVDFVWNGRLTGTSAGVITCVMDGVARTSFLKNRIGWCVLHPMDLAGLTAEVETPDGSVTAPFPERISPHQPFMDMQAITHPTRSGAEVTIRFEGDLFEMEDQRNWTDASYKTYSTPLRLPYPVEIEVGERVQQTVTVKVRASDGSLSEPAAETTPHVRIGTSPIAAVPPIGLGAASHGDPLSRVELDRLLPLKPAHLRLTLDLARTGWAERLRQVASEARGLGAALELEVIVGSRGGGLKELFERLRTVETAIARLLVFPRDGFVTTAPVARRAHELCAKIGLEAAIGGGSRAYFTELNRADLPLDLLEVVGYTINPQVHAFDQLSVVETLAAQAETVASAKAIAGDRPLAVGPITLRPRFNPNATGPEPETAAGELPPTVDARHPSLFAAAWTAGSIRQLGAAGVASLTYYETTGWRGVLERSDHPLRVRAFASRPGMAFPLYHILADVADFAGGLLLPVEISHPLRVEALALRAGDGLRVLVASLTDEPQTVTVTMPPLRDPTLRLLDETAFALATSDPAAFRGTASPLSVRDNQVTIDLQPYAVATIDGDVGIPDATS